MPLQRGNRRGQQRGRRTEDDKDVTEKPEDIFFSGRNIFCNGINVTTGEQADEEEASSLGKLTAVDYHITSNAKTHKTSEYEIVQDLLRPQLVVRRGDPFYLTVTMSKPYDKEKHDLRLIFQFGLNPKISKGTQVEMILSDEDLPNEWGAKLKEHKENSLKLEIFTPTDCFVGAWKLTVSVIKRGNEEKKKNEYRYQDNNKIFILFNPWCKDDSVFFPDEKYLEEYIMNESGFVYKGSYGKMWNFGQFQGHVLECANLLLDKNGLPPTARGNPILVTRALSAMTNVQDDNGVIVGNWSGDYSDGKSPSQWNGSVEILDSYYEDECPVMYGQCWVFSAVLTTLCRTLGIPTRSITNINSAHDTDRSATIDKTSDEDLLDISWNDSVWNFHLWNDVWIQRPDLPMGYGGWHAIDGTPQEESHGIYQCGPAPLRAIKNGEITIGYDCDFLFGEVNADYVYWSKDESGKLQTSIVNGEVGKYVYTNKPFSDRPESEWLNRQNITSDYKYPEGSPEEEAAKLKANMASTRPGIYGQKEKKDLKIELVEDNDLWFGADFKVSLKVTNLADEDRTIGGAITAYSVYTTGQVADLIKNQKFQKIKVPKKSSTLVPLTASYDEYDDKLVEYCNIRVSYICRVKETLQPYCKDEAFALRKPKLDVKLTPAVVKVGEEFKVEVSMKNPLAKKLTNCSLQIELPKVLKNQRIGEDQIGHVKPGETLNYSMKVKATAGNPGKRNVMVNFYSTQMEDVTGCCCYRIEN